jgi:hypothetical protein
MLRLWQIASNNDLITLAASLMIITVIRIIYQQVGTVCRNGRKRKMMEFQPENVAATKMDTKYGANNNNGIV